MSEWVDCEADVCVRERGWSTTECRGPRSVASWSSLNDGADRGPETEMSGISGPPALGRGELPRASPTPDRQSIPLEKGEYSQSLGSR